MTAPTMITSRLAQIAPTDPMQKSTKNLHNVMLQHLNCSFDVVTPVGENVQLKQVIKQQSKANGTDITIMYAIRQPSCPSCREHALQLCDFAKVDRKLALIGTVKETGIADEEILRFYQEYFRNPVYKDEKWNIYKALGAKKITLKEAMIGFFRNRARFQNKNIKFGKCSTEGFIQGGILIFDRDSNLHFAYKEDFQELDMELLKAAVAEARRRYRSSKTTRSSNSGSSIGGVSSSTTTIEIESEEDSSSS